MTWFETHERTRIIREVEAHAASDLSGRLPWKESWTPFFADREALLTMLKSRWDGMCVAQLDDLDPQQIAEVEAKLRRSNAGVLRILATHGRVGRGAVPTEAA